MHIFPKFFFEYLLHACMIIWEQYNPYITLTFQEKKTAQITMYLVYTWIN
jgi:hypothetical protein